VRTEYACRRGDKRNAAGSLALRATTVIWNDAAEKAGTIIWQNFRIPTHSIIHEAREDFLPQLRAATDDLSAWRSETSGPLSSRPLPVRVSARGNWAAIEIAG
jgi:hypothetical protein